MDNEEDDYPLNLDSPKRHSDPAPCTSSNGSGSTSSAFAFSVPDLRDYSQGCMPGSPSRSPLSSHSGTPSPARHPQGAVRRVHKHRRYSQGYPSSPLSSRRATHPNPSPARLRRNSLCVGEYSYRPLPNGDDKPFMAQESGCYRLRSFSVTSKGVVNLGDMVRTRSPSLTSEESISAENDFRERLPSIESTTSVLIPPTRFRVLLLGAEEVGKSSLLAQFTTSECLTTAATDMQESLDGSQERTVSLLVDGQETELSCEDPNDSTFEVEDSTFASTDAFLLVYSVTERKSLLSALQVLDQLRRKESHPNNSVPKVYILVANKIDLVRNRVISTAEGRSLADRNEIKYIETSVGFNHNVDELLVGIVTQIRLKKEQHQNSQSTAKNFIARSLKLTDKAKGFMDRLLQKCDLKTKSCDNLNVL